MIARLLVTFGPVISMREPGRGRPLVKMIKRWNRSAGKPFKPSLLIEVMMQDLVDAPFNDEPVMGHR